MKTKPIPKEAWSHVHEKALEIAHATMRDDERMASVYVEQMMDLLDDLEGEFGRHALLLSTRADYLVDQDERRALYEVALILAKEKGDHAGEKDILDSLREMER